MNPNLNLLQPYPFEKLNLLKNVPKITDKNAINLALGEPQHTIAPLLEQAIQQASINGFSKYPPTKGYATIRNSIADWLTKRFKLPSINPNEQILTVNGTREALFAFAQCLVDHTVSEPLVLIPNPFYQIYEGAAFLAGAKPWFINCQEENNWLPDFDSVPEEIWKNCQILYICSPNNPTGMVLDRNTLQDLLEKADKYDFVIAADECYSEIYASEDEPPVGLLQVCAEIGRLDFKRCIVFHSLSKRSNVPGLRSGFVAGDADIIRQFWLYRTYHGCAMSPVVQEISAIAWGDEKHVQVNRDLYRQKYAAVIDILAPIMEVDCPPASFYLWLKTPIIDTEFAQKLFIQQNVTVLPGSFLSRTFNGVNPGENRVRIALVASVEECIEAAKRLLDFMQDQS
ncbi:succinyldiaminopimelate transaminase [Candidatus Halobeggiatoa sp. HSG11]|nr:succinyldiaminopimelate transaminase [Candidatus Halobeggiatoa sp. HSG11]